MGNLSEILKVRYQAALESSSDSLFYQNVHAYIDVIVKTPLLASIMDASERKYGIEHSDLWHPYTNDERELDWRDLETYRIERFSLYASHYVTLLVRIYLPIEYYKNPKDPFDKRLDPVVMLMLRGFERTKAMKLWDKKSLKTYNNWFDNQRKSYEQDLRQFHVDLLTKIHENSISPSQTISEIKKPKIPLHLNIRTGDFTFRAISGTLSPASQEFKVLRTLYDDQDLQASYLSLVRSYQPSYQPEQNSVSKAYKDSLYQIIRNIKEKLGILPNTVGSNPDIIKTVRNHGYRLSLGPDEPEAE